MAPPPSPQDQDQDTQDVRDLNQDPAPSPPPPHTITMHLLRINNHKIIQLSRWEWGWRHYVDLYWREFLGLCHLLHDGGPPTEQERYIIRQTPNGDGLRTYHVYPRYCHVGAITLYVCPLDTPQEGHATSCLGCCDCHRDHLTPVLDLYPGDVHLLAGMSTSRDLRHLNIMGEGRGPRWL